MNMLYKSCVLIFQNIPLRCDGQVRTRGRAIRPSYNTRFWMRQSYIDPTTAVSSRRSTHIKKKKTKIKKKKKKKKKKTKKQKQATWLIFGLRSL
jgi:hypothetical protein